jgi:hypothetical protein
MDGSANFALTVAKESKVENAAGKPPKPDTTPKPAPAGAPKVDEKPKPTPADKEAQ